MKKNYLLLSGLALLTSGLFAQGIKSNTPEADMVPRMGEATKAKAINNNKAPGDTLYYDSFAGGPTPNDMPVGTWGNQTVTWTRSNPNNNGFDWVWSTSAPGGQYSTNITALNSTSANDGYMMLPGDAYNTPTPGTGFVNMDASFTSSAIGITPSPAVLISIETSNRYCCSQTAVDLILQVSTDGTTWSNAYDAADGNPPNVALANATRVTFNVSTDLAYQDTVYLRFTMQGGSHYYWMFDDLLITQGFDNSMELEDYGVNFSTSYVVNPVFSIVPQSIIGPMTFDGATVNAGGNAQTGVYLDAKVYHDSTLSGAPGDWLIYQDSIMISNFLPPSEKDTVRVGPYLNLREGYLRARINVIADSASQNPSETFDEYSFIVSDSILAKDRNVFRGSIGVGSYVDPRDDLAGGDQGDLWTTVVTVEDSALATSLSFFVGNEPENDGVQISPIIYEFEGDSLVSSTIDAAHTNLVAENLIPTTIDTNDFGTWITIDFATGFGTGNVWLQPGQQYAIGWRQENGGNGEAFFAGRAFNMERFQPDYTNFINFEGTRWGWVTSQPAVRLNLGNLTTGIDQVNSVNNISFAVSPNPTNGEFTLTAESKTAKTYNLNVRNMLGQSVHAEIIAVNGMMTKNMNLNGLEKGVYFVSLENDEEKLVKKVVLK